MPCCPLQEIAEIVNNGTNSIVPSSGGPSSDPIILPQVNQWNVHTVLQLSWAIVYNIIGVFLI